LAWAIFDLDRPKRQVQRDEIATDHIERRLHLIVALLGQILIALGRQADSQPAPRPAVLDDRHRLAQAADFPA
jgi:hypothetical protein